ncbi:TIGR02221 family CRISPR-associated protein [Saprospira grandis]|uniref:CRISPR-associated protein, TM1812 family n=1 Tax=Saprospira grandis (strain Lewin) TaxID=984262 RepID=H6L9L1_SAPGL|nr:TIGR02221 family CRISPR-associated protein [Saprospira grandis]AFC23189.1 CRISPR-associated protein, TM1812 family [Saprospira grandis str. Lewin]
MGRKVLISFLGKGILDRDALNRAYLKATYKIDEKSYEGEEFVSSPLSKHFAIDTKIIIGTMGSMWDALYTHYAKESDCYEEKIDEKYLEISEKADFDSEPQQVFADLEKALGVGSKVIPIYWGYNEVQMKQNLDIIIKGVDGTLQDGDELYLDITHGFRSSAVFITTILSYLREVSTKNLKIKGMFYGMLESARSLKHAPIIDLGSVDNMLEWSKAAYNFKNHGNGQLIADLLEKDNQQVLALKIRELTQAIRLSSVTQIKGLLGRVQKEMNDLSTQARLILPQTFKEFNDIITKSGSQESAFQILMAEWYAQKDFYAQAYILLVEAAVTYICEQNEVEDIASENSRRDAKNQAYGHREFNRNQLFKTINNVRKDIAHASIGGRNSFTADIRDLESRINRYKAIILK